VDDVVGEHDSLAGGGGGGLTSRCYLWPDC
jgi:hypothetical protein